MGNCRLILVRPGRRSASAIRPTKGAGGGLGSVDSMGVRSSSSSDSDAGAASH